MGLFTGLIGKYPTELACRAWLLACGYKSFKAIESEGSADDTQWLTFWMVISVVQFAEFWTDILRKYIPYYNEAKLGLMIWLGAMHGAAQIYTTVFRPFLKEKEALIDEKLAEAEEKAKPLLKK